MDALQIIIPFLGVIVGGFIGYFLNQALYERKRRDELADREFTRRTTVYDKRIQEAREYADNLHTMLVLLRDVTAVILKSKDVTDARQQLLEYIEDVAKITELHQIIAIQRIAVDVLNDGEIITLHTKLYSHLLNYSIYLSNIVGEIFKGTSVSIDSEDLKMFFHAAPDTDRLVIAMKQRLDGLSQNVK